MKNQRVFVRLAISTCSSCFPRLTSLGASSARDRPGRRLRHRRRGRSTPAARLPAENRHRPSLGAGINMAFVPKDIVNNYFANSFKGAQEAAGETGGTGPAGRSGHSGRHRPGAVHPDVDPAGRAGDRRLGQ